MVECLLAYLMILVVARIGPMRCSKVKTIYYKCHRPMNLRSEFPVGKTVAFVWRNWKVLRLLNCLAVTHFARDVSTPGCLSNKNVLSVALNYTLKTMIRMRTNGMTLRIAMEQKHWTTMAKLL